MHVRLSRLAVLAAIVVAFGGPLLYRMCSRDTREAIRVGENRVVVTNLTRSTWSNVDVWLNDYYRAQATDLAPDQRLEIPLDVFIAGFGQRFDVKRQSPSSVQVKARAADGTAVKLAWPAAGRTK